MKKLIFQACFGLGLGLIGSVNIQAKAQSQELCGSVSIATMNWQSADFLAVLDAFILKNGYECKVNVISADTVPAFTAMIERGQPDIIPEGWVDLVPEIIGRGLRENRVVDIGASLSDGGQQGLFIPKYIADNYPEIKTIEDAFNHPEIFPSPENPAKGAIYNTAPGSGGAVVTAQLYKAYQGALKNFELIDTGSPAGLDGSIARAYERGQAWFGYYWEPTSLLGRYDMVRLSGHPHDSQEWNRCTSVASCPDPQPNDWPRDQVRTIVTHSFANSAPQYVMDYLSARSLDNKTLNALLAWMSDNQATGEEGVRYFLVQHKEIWRSWVSSPAATKIEAAL